MRDLLVPKLYTTLKSYDRSQLGSDVVAGVIVGIVALPLAIAFAIASGVTPDRGLWTAIVAGFIISALGGSRVQIGGPTGAFVVIVYGIVHRYGIDGLMVATFMAGLILIAFGVLKFGAAIKFIPHPVITGFTAGIAVIIFSGEMKDFFGLRMGDVPPGFIDKWMSFGHATAMNTSAAAIALLALAIILVWPRINRRIPGPFVALIVTTALVSLAHLPVETIGSRFGEISAAIPHPHLPHVGAAQIASLIQPAFTIALLCAVESLLSAVVADGMTGGRHRSNVELVAQGLANIVSPLFGGIPATGAIARTATNVKNGGRTPVAGIVHALTLLVITLVAGRWASLIPMATLAAILVVVAYHMSSWRTFATELRSPKSDVAVLLTTFSLTVLVDLTVAIEVGMVLAAFLFIRRMGSVMSVHAVANADLDSLDGSDDDLSIAQERMPKGVQSYELNGPFFFGAAEAFKDTLTSIADRPRVLILRMRHVPALDSTGMNALREITHRFKREGTIVLLSELQTQPLIALRASPLGREIGVDNVCTNSKAAVQRARMLVGSANGGADLGGPASCPGTPDAAA